jgi:hypothetical protein
MMPRLPFIALAILSSIPSAASAWEYRTRFVERIGSTDFPLVGDMIDASSGEPRRIRIQFGVFDDESEPAPAGGFIGWLLGSITVSGAADNSDERRTPGRLTPFNFGEDHERPPRPEGDPFTTIVEIAATLGTQQHSWECDPDGNPSPMPPPFLRGLNSYASIYEVTIDPRPGASSYSLTVGGDLFAAAGWRFVGTPLPPNCDPNDGYPGHVVYAPFPVLSRSFESVFNVMVPAPGSAVLACVACLLATRRRRQE